MASEYVSLDRIQALLDDGFEVDEIDSNDHSVVVDLVRGPLRERVEIGRAEVARYLGMAPPASVGGLLFA